MAKEILKCSRCENDRRKGGRLCLSCHSADMRKWRESNPMTLEQKIKDRCRSYAGTYLRRGKLQKKPCEFCGDSNSQMHHPDYKKPLAVIWVCRLCHLWLHKRQRPTNQKTSYA